MRNSRVPALLLVSVVALVARMLWLSGEFNVNEPDEMMHLQIAESFSQGCLYPRYLPGGYRDGLWLCPPLPLYAAGLVFRIFGESLRNFRAMSLVFGMASVVAFDALCGLYLSRWPRVLAVLLFALSPLAVYESTLAMLGAASIFFLIVGLWAYVLHLREGRTSDLVVFAVCLGATAASRHYGVLFGGLVVFHWCWLRVVGQAIPLRRMAAGLALAIGTFLILVPWFFWRPYDAVHCYVYRLFVSHFVALLRGERGSGSLFGLPYPALMLAHGLVALLGLVMFLGTWRRKWDVMSFYALLLALPIMAFREVRYLSLTLPACYLFVGYLVEAVAETAAKVSRPVRWANGVLVVLLVASALPVGALPWRVRSGLPDACRYVAANTAPRAQVVSNYWRPIVERFTRRRVPLDWLDEKARDLIQRGEIRYVILDDSEYTRGAISSPERQRVAAWVRQSFPMVKSFGEVRGGTQVYLTARR